MSTALIVLIVLILANGLLAMGELAVLNARPARLQAAAESGSKGARQAMRLAQDPSRFLSTVQVGITLIGVLAGALGDKAMVAEVVPILRAIPTFAPYADQLALVTVVTAITGVSVVLGELVPKRLALIYPEFIASLLAGPLRWLSFLAAPLVLILGTTTEFFLQLFGFRRPADQGVTEEEIRIMIRQGASTGVLEHAESEIMDKVLRLADRRVSAVMTPRSDVTPIELDQSDEQIKAQILDNPRPYWPVCRDGTDDVVGLLNSHDVLGAVLRGRPINVVALMKRPIVVPENVSVLQALDAFRENPLQVALVADEYGSILGLVSQHDILSALVGELPSPEEPGGEERAVRRADGSWLIDGSLPIDEVRRIFELVELPGESEYDTLAGFVMFHMQRIPRTGDQFIWDRLKYEVVDMDGMRVDKVLVSSIDDAPKPPNA